MASEVDALLDYSGGLEDYHRDDPWRERVVEHFGWNIDQIMQLCKSKNVPILFVRPVSNLMDCPPIKFETNHLLSDDALASFNQAWDAARSAGDIDNALSNVDKALEIDPKHAGALYLKGKLMAELHQWEQAERSLIAARDEDVCPLRALSAIAESVSEHCRMRGVPCVNAELLFSDISEHGIVGNRWLVDHVHPTVEGHQLLGESIAEAFIQNKFVSESDADWRTLRTNVYRDHLKGLGEDYFHRGKQRLEGLLLWAQGRAKKIRQVEETAPK